MTEKSGSEKSGSEGAPDEFAIEPATPDDFLDVLRVLDGAMLETDAEAVDAAIDAGDALVARFKRTGAVVGALVVTRPELGRLHVEAVAVRRERRGRGIGSALVDAAVRRAERDAAVDALTAAFDADLRAFYADLGFAIRPAGDADRLGNDESRDGEGDLDRLWGRVAVDE